MLATLIYGERDIRLEEVPDPVLSTGIDAIVRVVAACVCGSDLWPYRGVNTQRRAPHRPRVRRDRRGDRRRGQEDQGWRLRHRPLLRLRHDLHQLRERCEHVLPQRRLVGSG
ncbi:MAG: hypothetical protein WDM88_07145 [Galbitalea sp.]